MTRHHRHVPSRSSSSPSPSSSSSCSNSKAHFSLTVLSSVTATRNLLFLTLLLSTLSHAFVTSNRFQTAASGVGSSKRASAAASSSGTSSSSRLNVLQVPPPSRAASATADDDELPSPSSSPKDSRKSRRPTGWGVAPMQSSGLFKAIKTTNASRRNNSNGFTVGTPIAVQEDYDDDDALRLERELRQVAEYVAETKLPTDVGQFQLRAYRVPGAPKGQEPCVIYARDKPPMGLAGIGKGAAHVPVRIHDQCLTSEVFRSQRYVFVFALLLLLLLLLLF
jgi:hypothetical protein